jgi:hypothetical protein
MMAIDAGKLEVDVDLDWRLMAIDARKRGAASDQPTELGKLKQKIFKRPKDSRRK